MESEISILYISDIDISRSNGPSVNEREFVFSISKILNERVKFILPQMSNNLDFDISNAKHYHFNQKGILEKSIFQIIPVSIKMILKYFSIKRNQNIDLVVFRLRNNSALCAIFLSFIKQPYVIKTLGISGLKNKEPINIFKRINRYILNSIYLRAIKGALAIDVCTTQYHNYYSKAYPNQHVELIENTVNIKRFVPKNRDLMKKNLGLKQFDKIIGYVGGSPSKRGATQLVNISPKLNELNKKIGIMIVGDDPQVKYLKRKTKNLGTDDIFIWTGVISYEKVVDYINCIDVGISLDLPERVLKIGNSSQKVRQYLSCGVPVISQRGTNLFIEKEKIGALVDCMNEQEIFNSIISILNIEKDELNKLSKRAKKYAAKNLSTDMSTIKRIEVWEKVLSSQKK